MAVIASVYEIGEKLLPKQAIPVDAESGFAENAALLVVLKQYRFHKQLCIALYEAPVTKTGKIKNPLTPVDPLAIIWKKQTPEELKFYAGIAKFQNNPTADRSASHITALKIIISNPLNLSFFYHDPAFSENVVAGSLQPVTIGSFVNDLSLLVNKPDDFYDITLQLTIDGKTYPFKELTLLYDYFFLVKDTLHLISHFHYLNVVQFFKQHRYGLRIHESKYKEFQQQVLDKLEDTVRIHYTYIQHATQDELATTNLNSSLQRLIYLSDLDNYVTINPVMRYGNTEIPVLSKKPLYFTNAAGQLTSVSRNDEAEAQFTALLLKQHPDFEEQLDNDLTHFYLHKERFLNEDWFLNAFEEWQQQDIVILGFDQLKGNQLNGNKANITIRVTSGLNWFNANIQVQFGKNKASLKQLRHAVRNNNKFVRLDDGTLGILPQEWIEKFTHYFNAGDIIDDAILIPKVNFSAIGQLYDAAMLDEQVKNELSVYQSRCRNVDAIENVPVPPALQASLRPYQQQGLNWLNFLDAYAFGGCLADDMGLGKSIQIIAFILLQRTKVPQNTNLLVVPTSLIFNWRAELQKFAPSIKLFTLYGAGREKDYRQFNAFEVILTSYGTLLSDVNYLKDYTFNYVFLDESQHIKNIESQRYQAARLLKSRNKIAITGTPVENNTFDLYAQLSFACPGLLGSQQYFRDTYAIPIDKFKDGKRALELQEKIAPFILRRTKKQVATELPEKTEMVLHCPMHTEQRSVYDAYEKEFRDFITGQSNEDIPRSAMHVLKGLTRLRQICDSPALLDDEKLTANTSSKIDTLIEQIENKSTQHKILIFSQFVSMLNLVRKELQSRNIAHAYLTGSTTDRASEVNDFQQNADIRVFLISLKAGGTGLNLTEADYVYIVDPWWNPAVENQAIDRCYRIGQQKHVVAVRLICPDTIEDKIMQLQASKKDLSDDLVKPDNAVLTSLTKQELLSLVS